MIAGLKPYPAMKDSGVPWVGEVPDHWRTQKLKYLASLHGRIGFHGLSSADYRGSGIVLVGGTNFRLGSVDWASCHRIDEEWYDKDRNIQLRDGDLLITKDGTIGKTALIERVPERAVLNSGVMVVRAARSSDFVSRYVLHCLNSRMFSEFIELKKTGATIHHLYEATFYNFPVLLPPLEEQAAIVKFLDHADRRIRRYIAAKTKLIKLLEEQKQAIIHRAVTRGLEPDVRLKPSGIEWLGDIPEHWDAKPAKWFFREVDERSVDGTEEMLSVSHITGVTPRSQKNITMFMAESYAGHKLCRAGDLVINTMWAWMAALGVSRQTGIVSPAYAVYRPRDRESYIPEYLDGLLRTKPYIAEYTCRSTGIRSSRLRLYPEEFFRIPLVHPPLKEQRAIVAEVAGATGELQRAIHLAQREIAFLREYRTRLIADVVTGKLDVRDATASLPDEVDAIEDSDALVEDDEVDDEAADEEDLA